MKYSPIKMPFGIREDNALVHISEVEIRDTRTFKCLSCGTNLIPVIYVKKRQKHFRHDSLSVCDGESVIHKAAKKIILERKQITLPNNDCVSFESICDEVPLHGIRADVLAARQGGELVIEIYYRHKVDDDKIRKIKNANISAIEINLSELKVEDLENRDAFWLYINDPNHVTWLHQAPTQQMMVQEKKEPIILTAEEKEQVRKVIENLQALKAGKVYHIMKPLKRYYTQGLWKALPPTKLPGLKKQKPTRL